MRSVVATAIPATMSSSSAPVACSWEFRHLAASVFGIGEYEEKYLDQELRQTHLFSSYKWVILSSGVSSKTHQVGSCGWRGQQGRPLGDSCRRPACGNRQTPAPRQRPEHPPELHDVGGFPDRPSATTWRREMPPGSTADHWRLKNKREMSMCNAIQRAASVLDLDCHIT